MFPLLLVLAEDSKRARLHKMASAAAAGQSLPERMNQGTLRSVDACAA
jgi:hypothetical protein